MPLSTANRMFFLTPENYGEDDLLILEMQGEESLSRLFRFSLKLISLDNNIDPARLIGHPASLRIETWDSSVSGGERHWTGFISRFSRTGRAASADDDDLYAYECELVPWLWFMGRQRDLRVFQNMSIPDVIEELLREQGFSDYELTLNKTYPALIYCIQYNETTYNFISRMLERAGIWCFYKHNVGEDSRHVLVFSDNNDSCPQQDPSWVPFHHEGHASGSDAITEISSTEALRTGKIAWRDWDFTRTAALPAESPTVIRIGSNDQLEHYHFHAGDIDTGLGQALSEVMMEAEEAAYMEYMGSSQLRNIEPGYFFTLEDHPLASFNRKMLTTSVRHHGHNNLMSGEPASYHNRFTCIPFEVPYRSRLLTPPPCIQGPQTALVVGPPGEEIHTDKYGRIKIQLHWDRLGKFDDKSSAWVRVSQPWAGSSYGAIFIPRVGMEVVVQFLNGDPDQPLVTGCVYNSNNPPPHPLPGEATKSGFKTLSSKGGGGTNELTFDDKKGQELLFMQAERDMVVNIKADRTETIGKDFKLQVDGSWTGQANKGLNLISQADLLTGAYNEWISVGKKLVILNSFEDETEVSADKSLHLCSETNDINVYAKLGSIVCDAMQTISLKAGPSSIVLGPSGVTIDGPIVSINCGGSPKSAPMPPSVELLETEIEGGESIDGKVTNPGQQDQAKALHDAAKAGQPFCAECEAARKAVEQMNK
ncbi:MAG: type VI secretion system tip protein TssI/VgrG [Pseudomonadota bacterium]|nr:type VI secretion system tip protein TssI/VgrG [Pseudomonadota bacterium]